MKKNTFMLGMATAAMATVGLGLTTSAKTVKPVTTKVATTKTVAKTTTKTTAPTIKVNNIYATTKTVSGKATKGVDVIVRTADKKVLAKTVANKKTGAFSIKLKQNIKVNQKIYVYARASHTSFFYRIMTVQAGKAAANTTTAAGTTTTIKNNPNVAIKTPTGTWKSGNNNGYRVVTKFSQVTGLNQSLYKNNKFQKKLITNATYKVTPHSNAFWTISYKEHGDKKASKFYMRFNSNKQFVLVNAKNKAVKVQFDKTPLSYYKFNLVK